MRVVKILGDALDETDVFPQYGQLSRGDGRPLAVTPDYPAVEATLGEQAFEVVQETDAERRLGRPAWPANDARERSFKLDSVSRIEGCSLPLTLHQSK